MPPDCSCWHEIIDDQGSTIVAEHDTHCTIHGKGTPPMNHTPDIGNYAFPCTTGLHQFCDGEVEQRDYTHPIPCDCACHMDQVKLG